YAPDYFCKRKEMYAKDIWEFDSIKIKTAEDNGYKVMVIWESDFYKNPEDTMARAKSFILENNI
ncbi:MAG: hypothetical protein RSE41_09240, partial [Clostridia bacterium]